MSAFRCAIYTRKSSEEGLKQDFNSLHAQREACAAYILSQASEGWSLLPEHYDDGGISGGTLARPALKRLLEDIAAGKIDIVVVYKVDRLTRSLMDFSTLVRALDEAGTSFVSVTQAFNTTNSMGRLTLNMLLSFAQFEREVTAERIRDKIAASKAKGMWMGGVPPIGYEPAGRTLKIVPEHAAIVRVIFERYLEMNSVRELQKNLTADGILTPIRHMAGGRRFGGIPFSRGQIYPMLRSCIYVGRIPHKDTSYPGQHPAIVDQELWDRVQQKLADQTNGPRRRARAAHPSMLAGLVFDAQGQRMISMHACKGKRRYRYYVSHGLHHRHVQIEGPGMRIPARELETAVVEQLATAFDEPLKLLSFARLPLDSVDLATMPSKANEIAARIRSCEIALIHELVASITMDTGHARMQLRATAIATALEIRDAVSDELVEVNIDAKLSRSGRAMRLVQIDGRRAGGALGDQSLIKLIAKARKWWALLKQGDIHVAGLAREEDVTRSYMSNAIRIAFLSPRLVEMIVGGEQPTQLTAQKLIQTSLPLGWKDQEARLG
jgi:DNA invertase Pin-like site-specific DNA recombinase